MKKLLSRAGLSLAILAVTVLTAAAQTAGYSVTTAGDISGAVVSGPAPIMLGLAKGTAIISTASGGTMTVRVAPAVGQALSTGAKFPSDPNGKAASAAIGGALQAAGLPAGVVTSYVSAVAAITGGSKSYQVTAAMNNAMAAMHAAQASGAVTPEQAKSLLAILVATSKALGRY